MAFLQPLPVRILYGVGKVTEHVLNQAGLRTVGDLRNYNLRALVGSYGVKLKQFAFDCPRAACYKYSALI